MSSLLRFLRQIFKIDKLLEMRLLSANKAEQEMLSDKRSFLAFCASYFA